MDNNNCAAHNGVAINGNHDVKFTLYHNESETSIGNDLDSFYEVPHNNFEATKRGTEKRYINER